MMYGPRKSSLCITGSNRIYQPAFWMEPTLLLANFPINDNFSLLILILYMIMVEVSTSEVVYDCVDKANSL